MQLFFCRNEKANCSDSGPRSHLVRMVRVSKAPPPKPPKKKIEGSFSPKCIEGWKDFGEMPRWVELGDSTSKSMGRKLAALGFEYFDGDDDVGEGPGVSPQLGDKLLGWPCWIDKPEMQCSMRGCKSKLQHVFQVDSEDNVPWMWGDSGTAWIFQCPTHHEVLMLEWQGH